MGTSWAVGAAATLATFAFLAPSSLFTSPPIGPADPHLISLWALGVVSLATWAYAIALAAFGSRGAVLALLANALAAIAAALVFVIRIGFGIPVALLLVVAALTAWACGAELDTRRGRIQWGVAVAYSLATVALVAWDVAQFLQPVTR